MGPDNRATDVTLPAICSQHQPCPPCTPHFAPLPPSALVRGARGRAGPGAGGGWPVMADGDREMIWG